MNGVPKIHPSDVRIALFNRVSEGPAQRNNIRLHLHRVVWTIQTLKKFIRDDEVDEKGLAKRLQLTSKAMRTSLHTNL